MLLGHTRPFRTRICPPSSTSRNNARSIPRRPTGRSQQAAAIVAPRAAAPDEACDRADQTTSVRSAGRATRSGTRRPRLRMPGGWPRGFPCATPENRPRASRARSHRGSARWPRLGTPPGSIGKERRDAPLSYPPRAEGTQKVSAAGVAGNRTVCRAGMRPAGNPKAVLRARCSERLRRMENRTFNAAAVGPASDRRPTIGVRQIACEGGADQLSYSVQWPARRQKGVIC